MSKSWGPHDIGGQERGPVDLPAVSSITEG